MKNKGLVFALCGAVVFGLLAALSVNSYLTQVKSAEEQNTIVLAKVELPLGAKLVAEQLQTVKLPPGAIPEGSFTDLAKVVGRVTVTRIGPREPITQARLAPLGSTGGLSAIIPEGFRAMTVRVDDETGLSGFLLPGALVDVLAVIQPVGQGGEQGSISKIVLQNIKVLANGGNLDEPSNQRETQSVRTVTLLVTPDQSEKLTLAATEGRLRLSLRNAVDQLDQHTAGANKNTLLRGGQALPLPLPGKPLNEQPLPVRRAVARPAPPPNFRVENLNPEPLAPKPTPRNSIEIFEGLKKRNVDFP